MSSSRDWRNSGTAWRGEFLTQNTSEAPSDAVESSLSDILETEAPKQYFLEKEVVQKWLQRHESRGHTLPEDLQSALKKIGSTSSNTRRLGESQPRGRKQKAIAGTARPTRSTPEEGRTWCVRHLLPSECEALQGFPEGWTAVDTES